MSYTNSKQELIKHIDSKIEELNKEINDLKNKRQALSNSEKIEGLIQMFKDAVISGDLISFETSQEIKYYKVKHVEDMSFFDDKIRFEFDKKITISKTMCMITKDDVIGYIYLEDDDLNRYSSEAVESVNEKIKKFLL